MVGTAGWETELNVALAIQRQDDLNTQKMAEWMLWKNGYSFGSHLLLPDSVKFDLVSHKLFFTSKKLEDLPIGKWPAQKN